MDRPCAPVQPLTSLGCCSAGAQIAGRAWGRCLASDRLGRVCGAVQAYNRTDQGISPPCCSRAPPAPAPDATTDQTRPAVAHSPSCLSLQRGVRARAVAVEASKLSPEQLAFLERKRSSSPAPAPVRLAAVGIGASVRVDWT